MLVYLEMFYDCYINLYYSGTGNTMQFHLAQGIFHYTEENNALIN